MKELIIRLKLSLFKPCLCLLVLTPVGLSLALIVYVLFYDSTAISVCSANEVQQIAFYGHIMFISKISYQETVCQ